ncbi:MAG: type VI secretion system amidase immunity protein Tai4 [Snodgrassella sp.]|uniref:type VI secretion system amidase immunity protein Tai4 n=1 Tax=Snodgrassella sp. TaxID=2815304 RepID=UPI0025846B17|nr:type VI secretion system amidase immunity protein Tai4 [Snodgrassella sp.]MCO6503916.1 type VI secretion system amidase immunity protein Tai4 [Snodgrassella sp.]MCO6520567.1 type VI secretion system amidase immunity protein Tai4 [Snodgrassella sp.]
MKKFKMQILCSCYFILLPLVCSASSINSMTPEAVNRTFIQNYKDMVLGNCLAQAYGDIASMDAGSSVSALIEWTYYNMDKSIDEEIRIIDSYLSRNYLNPLAEAEIKGIKFDFLKCLDLYHSKDLDKLAKKMIEHPQDTFRSTIRNYYRDLNRKK